MYQISNFGRIKNKYNKIKKLSYDKDGYLRTSLYKNGKPKSVRVHRLVADAFIKNPNNFSQVNHKNEIKDDNVVENLEWCDINYNNRYSKSKPVLQYDLKGNFIKEWESVRDIVRELGFNLECITGCCYKKYKTSHGFIWRYKNTSKVFKLCYIDTNCAYFTNDFEHQWGDDFNDAPYEHNAGEPYHSYSELIEDNADLFKRIYIHLPIQIKKIYFELPYWGYLPCDRFLNSPYSVEDINKKAVAWIHTEDFNILAETTLEDFKKTIKKHGGSIYVKED